MKSQQANATKTGVSSLPEFPDHRSAATKTGAAAAPPQFVRKIAVRRIVADHRERPSGVPAALATHPNVNLTIHNLSLGDYCVNDTLIVERKTLTDFAISVIDGRLFTQASRLTRTRRARACLILEGTARQYPIPAITREAFQGALITVTLVFGLPVLRSSSPEETADLILYAADQLHRRTTGPPHRYSYHHNGLGRQQVFLLQAIPGIGPARAQKLLDTFGSPFGVAQATTEALQTVKGIGASAADKIHRVFHGE